MDFANAFKFLQRLSRNNNRDWFEKNKEQWLQIKTSFEEFISEVYDSVCEIDPAVSGQNPKKLVFRIYRDVRFSKDKRPYKTFLSAGISPQGKGVGVPGYYIQFEPGNRSFICTGLYAPSPEALAKVRQEIDYNGAELKKYFPTATSGNIMRVFGKEIRLKPRRRDILKIMNTSNG